MEFEERVDHGEQLLLVGGVATLRLIQLAGAECHDVARCNGVRSVVWLVEKRAHSGLRGVQNDDEQFVKVRVNQPRRPRYCQLGEFEVLPRVVRPRNDALLHLERLEWGRQLRVVADVATKERE